MGTAPAYHKPHEGKLVVYDHTHAEHAPSIKVTSPNGIRDPDTQHLLSPESLKSGKLDMTDIEQMKHKNIQQQSQYKNRVTHMAWKSRNDPMDLHKQIV